MLYGAAVTSTVDLGTLSETAPVFPTVALQHRNVVQLADVATLTRAYESQGRSLSVVLRGPHIHIQIDNMLRFSLMRGRSTVLCTTTPTASLAQIRYWFLQKIMPLHLLLTGAAEILHAGAVEVRRGIVAFLAPSGTGKSTLVKHYIDQGHSLVADEHLVVHTLSSTAVPTIPYVRFLRKPECLGALTSQMCHRNHDVKAIYLLERASPDADGTCEALQGATACAALCTHAQFRTQAFFASPHFRDFPARRLSHLAALAAKTCVERLYVPHDLSRLPDVYATIQRDLEEC